MAWQKFAAHATHVGLYLDMLLMPISGWLMQSADGRNVSLFGWMTLPKIIVVYISLYGFYGLYCLY